MGRDRTVRGEHDAARGFLECVGRLRSRTLRQAAVQLENVKRQQRSIQFSVHGDQICRGPEHNDLGIRFRSFDFGLDKGQHCGEDVLRFGDNDRELGDPIDCRRLGLVERGYLRVAWFEDIGEYIFDLRWHCCRETHALPVAFGLGREGAEYALDVRQESYNAVSIRGRSREA